jgi:hypothetical protein
MEGQFEDVFVADHRVDFDTREGVDPAGVVRVAERTGSVAAESQDRRVVASSSQFTPIEFEDQP